MAVPPFYTEYDKPRLYCTANQSPIWKCAICNALLVACILIVSAAGMGLYELIKHTK